MSLIIRKMNEEPGEEMNEPGYVGVNSTMVVTKRDDLSAYSARLMRIKPSGKTVFHKHPREHSVLILSGKIRVETNDEFLEASRGYVVTIPGNTKHRFYNSTKKPTAIFIQNMFPEENPIKLIQEGKGELHAWMDPDAARKWMRENKSRQLIDKTMSIQEAVAKYTKDGDYFAMGGFGHIRVSMAGIYEMIRQGRKNLIMAGKTSVHDIDILIGGGAVDRVDCAYAFGHELRGLSPTGRRAVESGKVKVIAELSNAAFQWRFKAAAMGLSWLPARVMLGTDTLEYSSAKVMTDPFTGKPITLLPACYPDFVFIHVHRCDKFGNAQIDGIIMEDMELAMAAKRLIITTEKIVDEEVIRRSPDRTTIPFYIVDAVCHVPYGSHPGNMPGLYYSDEKHMAEWLSLSKTDEGVKEYLDKYVHGVKDFKMYVKLIGGRSKMRYLKKLENLEVPLETPWRRQ